MQIQQLIFNLLSKTKQLIHQKRATILSKMVASAITNSKDIFLTNLGHNLDIQTSIKHIFVAQIMLYDNFKLYKKDDKRYVFNAE